MPLPYIRDILGHVDLSTTEMYARASTEAKRKVLEAAHPGIVTSDLPEWNQDPRPPRTLHMWGMAPATPRCAAGRWPARTRGRATPRPARL